VSVPRHSPALLGKNSASLRRDYDRRILAWKTEQLRQLGLSWLLARTFAPLVDWHEVAQLVEHG